MQIRQLVDDFVWKRSASSPASMPLRLALISMWKFKRDGGFLRASALTYTTTLSLVPFLAITFSMLKGLGVQKRLEPLLLNYFAAGHQDIATKIIEYVDRTNVGALGAVGMVALILTAISLLGNIEESFNTIWGVSRGRSIVRKISDYTALMLACPVLLLLSTSMATTSKIKQYLPEMVAEQALPLIFALIPFLAKALAFAAIYLILPNRRVGLKAAIIGGAAAGVCWHIAEWFYISFQVGVTKYNAIYGALAQLPLFLVWVYLGWCIVLMGAQLACILELPARGSYLKEEKVSLIPKPGTLVPVLREVANRFCAGKEALTFKELCDEGGISPDNCARAVGILVEHGYMLHTDESPHRIVPAVSPDRLTMGEMMRTFLGSGREGEEVEDFLRELTAGFEGLSWGEWARRHEKTVQNLDK